MKCIKCGASFRAICVACIESAVISQMDIPSLYYTVYSPELERYLQDGGSEHLWGHEQWAKFVLKDLKQMYNRYANSEDMYGNTEYSELLFNSYVIPLDKKYGELVPDFLNAVPFNDVWQLEE